MKHTTKELLCRYVAVVTVALALRCLCAAIKPVDNASIISIFITAFVVILIQEVIGHHDDKNH